MCDFLCAFSWQYFLSFSIEMLEIDLDISLVYEFSSTYCQQFGSFVGISSEVFARTITCFFGLKVPYSGRAKKHIRLASQSCVACDCRLVAKQEELCMSQVGCFRDLRCQYN